MIYFVTKEQEYYRKAFSAPTFNDILVLLPEDGIDLYFETITSPAT